MSKNVEWHKTGQKLDFAQERNLDDPAIIPDNPPKRLEETLSEEDTNMDGYHYTVEIYQGFTLMSECILQARNEMCVMEILKTVLDKEPDLNIKIINSWKRN